MIYLTPDCRIHPDYLHAFGAFETLGSRHHIERFSVAGGDNGRFAPTGVNPRWTEAAWLRMLAFYNEAQRAKFRFMLVPDVPFNAAATLDLFDHYLPAVVDYGYPPAICTQDGMTVSDIPWDQLSAIFIGGSDDHKLGREGAALAMEAKRRGLWVHVGRVNSILRMQRVWWADSVDGGMLAFNSGLHRQALLVRGVAYCRAIKATGRLL